MALEDDDIKGSFKELIDAVRENTAAIRAGGAGLGGGGGGVGPGGATKAARGAGGFFSGAGAAALRATGFAGFAGTASSSGLGTALGGAVGGAVGGIAGAVFDETIGFAANATLRAGRRAAREFALVGATRAAEFGNSVSGSAIAQTAFTDAVGTLPIFGGAARAVSAPRENALARAQGLFGPAERLGAKFSPEFKDQVLRNFQSQEERASAGAKDTEARSLNLAGQRGEAQQVLNNLNKELGNIGIVLAKLLNYLRSRGG